MTHTDRDHTPVAEQITELLTELHDRVDTRETVLRYREVKRGGGRTAAVADFVEHRTRRPGLIAQARAASVPQGSPGWDADGALSPMAGGGSFESAEPVTEAFHLAEETAAALAELIEDARAAGHDSLITAALADEEHGQRIAARLRSLVSRARVQLKYDARIVPLRDVACPKCGGELRVRADASSAVWCTGLIPAEDSPVDEDGTATEWERCGANWPHGSWVRLLEEATA